MLDEPFSGLDVNAGLLFRTLLRLLADEGRMIFFSTHRFDMVEKLCSRVVILSAGRVVAEQRVADFDRAGRARSRRRSCASRAGRLRPLARQILDTITAE